ELHHERCNPLGRKHFDDLIVSEVLNSLVSLSLKCFVGLLELRLHLSQAIKQLLCLDLNSLDATLRPLLTLRKGGKRLDRLVEISLEEASFLGVEHISQIRPVFFAQALDKDCQLSINAVALSGEVIDLVTEFRQVQVTDDLESRYTAFPAGLDVDLLLVLG